MQKVSWYLTASLVTVSLLIGTAFGYFISPEYQQTMLLKEEMDLGAADRWVDLRYINAMIAHHRGAMLVAEQMKKSQRKEMQDLSAAILAGEPKLISELYDWKKSWYNDDRKVKDPAVPKFGEDDDTFDLRVLNTVIAHHEAGIKMTKEIRVKSARKEVINNADAVEDFLSKSIVMLKGMRTQWYSIN